MPIYTIQSPDGKTYDIEGPEGATADQLGAFIQSQAKPSEPLGQRINREIAEIPRQLGLTARHAIEGGGEALDFLSSPIRAGLNSVLPKKAQTLSGLVTGADREPAITGSSGKTVADWLGLPQPQGMTENIVAEGTKMLAPAASFIKAGQAMSKLGGVAGNVGSALAANPAAQLQSAAGAGLLGGTIKETGGNDLAQFGGALLGGIAAPVGVAAAKALPGAAMSAAKRVVAEVAPGVAKPAEAPQVTVVINSALRNSGVTLDQLPANVQASLRADVSAAMRQGDSLDPAALQRLVDYRLVGATPRNANLTLDPVALTQQKNLAKLGANSKDPAAQVLARAENENNAALIRNLNDLGAGRGDLYRAGESIVGSVLSRDATMQAQENALYRAAREQAGRQIPLDRETFVNDAYQRLAESGKGAFLPGEIGNLLNQIRAGKFSNAGQTFDVPFNVDVIDNLKTTLATASRGTTDGNVRAAIRSVRDALEGAQIDAKGFQVGGNQVASREAMAGAQARANDLSGDAMRAFDEARAFARGRRQWQESSPAVEAALNGAQPDRFVEQFIIGSGDRASANHAHLLRTELENNPEALGQTKAAIANWLKGKALSGAADEVGNFSQSAYNKAIRQIGDNKLRMFFSDGEINQLKAVGRVASYEQVQPRGSAVNNSNTAPTLVATVLDRIGSSPLLSKIPLGGLLADPAQNIAVGMRSRAATNVPNALLMPYRKPQPGMAISPAVGLLGFSE